jgi:hypothetical protein
VCVPPAPQVGGLLPPMPQQPVPQQTVPINPNTKGTRTTTTWQSSSMSTTTERFEW